MIITKKREVAIIHIMIAVMIHLKTTGHVEAIENVGEQGISAKCSKGKGIEVKFDLLNVAKTGINCKALGLRQK